MVREDMSGRSNWFTIWVSPRLTIRRIIAENPNRSLWTLATIYGFSSLLGTFQSFSLGSVLGMVPLFILALVIAPIWGYILFAIWSWMVSWTGRWLKGIGDFQTVRAAYSWSCVPILASDLIWIAMMVVFGSVLFSVPAGGQAILPQGQAILLLALLFGKVILSIWSLVIYLNALAEVQGFSILRAIGNVVIAGVLLAIIVGILSYICMVILGVSADQSASAGGAAFQILQEGKMMYSQAI
jgi:hypothetical protein